jgi:hypothetical protein
MNKYNNKKTIVDDIPFDSMLEARAYKYLRDNGNYLIYELQPEFELQAKFKHRGKTVRAIKYIADFMVAYKGRFYVVDAKGMETPAFKIKLKMLITKKLRIHICRLLFRRRITKHVTHFNKESDKIKYFLLECRYIVMIILLLIIVSSLLQALGTTTFIKT